MKLRYTVESSFIPSFTSSRTVNSIQESDVMVERLRQIKCMYGQYKYTNFRLYADDEIMIKSYSSKPINPHI